MIPRPSARPWCGPHPWEGQYFQFSVLVTSTPSCRRPQTRKPRPRWASWHTRVTGIIIGTSVPRSQAPAPSTCLFLDLGERNFLDEVRSWGDKRWVHGDGEAQTLRTNPTQSQRSVLAAASSLGLAPPGPWGSRGHHGAAGQGGVVPARLRHRANLRGVWLTNALGLCVWPQNYRLRARKGRRGLSPASCELQSSVTGPGLSPAGLPRFPRGPKR